METTRNEIELRLAVIDHYFDPGDPLYVDPSSLSPEELDQYEIAKFDFEFVQADKSFGSHNGDYARAMLTEVETFFGVGARLYDALGGGFLPADALNTY